MELATMNEINTIFNQENFDSSVRKGKSAVEALVYVKNEI